MSKLLLVEDDNNLREIYEARLQAEGYTIVTAKDGEEALAIAKAEKPDLIVSDVMMPKISGFEMLDILKNTDGLKNVKVIMLTALGQNDDQQRADRLGADKYLVKSQVTLEDIVRVAHELLEDGQPAPAAVDPGVATTPAPAPVSPPAEPVPTEVTPAPAEPAAPVEAAPAPVAPDPEPVAPTSDPVTSPVGQSLAPDEATSTSDESAAVQSQIDNFVNSATEPSEPAAPAPVTPPAEPVPTEVTPAPAEPAAPVEAAPAPVTPPAEPVAPTSDPVTSPTDSSTSAASTNGKLMDEAVNSLMSTKSPAPAATPDPVSAAPATPSADPVSATPAPIVPAPTSVSPPEGEAPAEEKSVDEPGDDPAQATGATMSHGKIITPPPHSELVEKKPDIQELLKAEEAKEATAQASAPPPAVAPDPATGQPPVDPNSIAL